MIQLVILQISRSCTRICTNVKSGYPSGYPFLHAYSNIPILGNALLRLYDRDLEIMIFQIRRSCTLIHKKLKSGYPSGYPFLSRIGIYLHVCKSILSLLGVRQIWNLLVRIRTSSRIAAPTPIGIGSMMPLDVGVVIMSHSYPSASSMFSTSLLTWR